MIIRKPLFKNQMYIYLSFFEFPRSFDHSGFAELIFTFFYKYELLF